MNPNIPEPSDFPAYAPPWPTAPAGFANRVVAAVESQHRTHRRKVWLVRAGVAALAASVALAVALGLPTRQPEVVVVVPTTPIENPKPTPIQKPFADAGDALAAISKATTDKALAPSKTMLASAERLPMPKDADARMTVDTKGFFESTESARAGLDPVSSQPRRAMNRMFRDFGIAPAKPRS